MGMLCLDTEGCHFENRDKARFCAQCGIPLQGTLVQGRYEIQILVSKDQKTVTLQALDRHGGWPVTLRALLPTKAGAAERESFLQDAELAASFSDHMQDPGSIRVTDYGQDGPLTFLVKSEYVPAAKADDHQSARPRMTVRVEDNLAVPRWPLSSPAGITSDSRFDDEDELQTQLRMAVSMPPMPPLPVKTAAAQPRFSKPAPTPVLRNWLAEANHAYEAARYNDALAAYEIATQQNVVSVEAWSGKGASLLHLGQPEEALLAYDHALSLQPNDPDLWNARASVLHELHRYDEEMYCYDQALVCNPNYAFAWSGRGMTLAELGRAEEAI